MDRSEWTARLLDQSGYLYGVPDLERVAEAAGVQEILYKDMGALDGLNRPGSTGRVILVNSNRSRARQRFTLAHEIAHMYFVGSSERSAARGAVTDDEERLCDQMAAEFLMPTDLVEGVIWQHGTGMDSVQALSGTAGVSLETAALRLSDLSEVKLGVIYWQQNQSEAKELQVKWSRVSPDENLGPLGIYGKYLPRGFRAPEHSGPVTAAESQIRVDRREAMQGNGRGPAHLVQSVPISGSRAVLSTVIFSGWPMNRVDRRNGGSEF